MSGDYVVVVEGLSAALDRVEEIPGKVIRNARRAVNATAERGRVEGGRRVRREVNFPARYFTGDKPRLAVTRKASDDSLEATITGRKRPTSLATFASGNARPGSRGGVHVAVKPGHAVHLRRAFLMKLRAGNADLDTKFNLGLAIRLKPGETIANKRKMIRVQKGLYLLYGPSVDQVFRSVSGAIRPEMTDFLESEFLRLMDLDL